MANSVSEKGILSASTDGMGIKIAATATAGTLVHTGPDADTAAEGLFHEIYLYATNSSTTVPQVVTVEFGDATAPDSNIVTVVPISTTMLILPGLLLKANATPKTVKVFSTTTNVTMINGYYHKIT